MTNTAPNRTNPLLNTNGRYRVEFLDGRSPDWQLNASSDSLSEARGMLDTLDDMGYECQTRLVDTKTGRDLSQ